MDQRLSHSTHTVHEVLVHIQRPGDQGYPAELITSSGETCAWSIEQFPELRELDWVTDAERLNPEGVSIWLYSLGCTLFNTLRDGIPPSVADWLAHLRERGQALRLRLWIDDPRVAALPWELMHHAQTREWLLQSPWFSLVRSHLKAVDLETTAAYALNRAVADAFFAHMRRFLQQGDDFESSFNAWRRDGSFDLEWYRGLPMLLEAQPRGAPEQALFWLRPERGNATACLVVLSRQDFWRHATLEDYLSPASEAPVVRGDPASTLEAINAQNSQGFINHPSAPVTQNFGTQYHLNGTVINLPPAPDKIIGALDLRLDTAVPEQVYLNEPFKLAVAIRLPTSPALDLPGLPQHFNEPFEADELESLPLIFRIEVQESSAYRMVGPTFHLVRCRKGKDSPAFYFELIPLHLGALDIVINVLQETANIGAMRLTTTALDPALKTRGQVAAQVQVLAAPAWAAPKTLRGAPEPNHLADVEAALHRLVELLTPPEERAEIDQWVTALCQEARRGDQANVARTQQIFTHLRSGAPEICHAAAGALRLPVRGVGSMLRQIAESEFQRGAD